MLFNSNDYFVLGQQTKILILRNIFFLREVCSRNARYTLLRYCLQIVNCRGQCNVTQAILMDILLEESWRMKFLIIFTIQILPKELLKVRNTFSLLIIVTNSAAVFPRIESINIISLWLYIRDEV